MKLHTEMHHTAGCERVRQARIKVNNGSHKAYRRKGYRVIIDIWSRDQLRWAVYRPRMHTPVATGVVMDMDAAIAGANSWIAADPNASRVT
jgi:hypothetical protein